ncbi:MAG: hypothetical protein M3Y87_14615, partial [Myxococcota bacterium]|nr:hypothetical protein [Myxococcota bacterium]
MRRLFPAVAIVALSLSFAGAARAQEGEGRVEALSVRGDGERADVVIRGAFDVPTYAVRSREGGRIVVVDVQSATMPESGAALDGSASLITRTTTSTSARGVRIELEARVPVAYRVRASSGRIQLRLEVLPPGSEDTAADAVPVVHGAAEPAGDEGTPTAE